MKTKHGAHNMELIALIIAFIVAISYAGKAFKWVVNTIYYTITGKQLDIWEN